ncbi:MAG: HDIG domain-containing protein [Verrucomicrobiota bacterium]|nr:HDIG domain-containing protein [Verrucomicrobiota bacterium]
MSTLISRLRDRKAKLRERQAAKSALSRILPSWKVRANLLLGFVFWVMAIAIMSLDNILSPPPGHEWLLHMAGDAVFLLSGLLAIVLFLKIKKQAFLKETSNLTLVSLISLLTLLASKTLLSASRNAPWLSPEIAGFLLPYAFVPLLAGILLDTTVGIAAGLWTGLALALMAGRSLPLFICGMLASLVAVTLAGNVRARSRVLKTGTVAGLSQIACVLGLAALHWRNPDWPLRLTAHQAVACLAGGFLSAMLALLFLPLLEISFRITTDIRLLELSDLRHPLLQRLAIEAPGTYHHSLLVAGLAQAAADEIGANSLLARISSYFHDVGKLTKPEFFAENIHGRTNPHDDLPPSMSSLVITSHIKEGLSLAASHRLPEPIRRAIREHHGTSLLSYFHYKARSQIERPLFDTEKASPNGSIKVDETVFRYHGQKPSTRESTIVCLADAVEAASRTMEKTSPGHIEELANQVVNSRLEDDQLDQCDLTIAELAKVKRSFVFTLTNMLHSRVPYPKDEDRDLQPTKAVPDQSSADTEPDSPSGHAG